MKANEARNASLRDGNGGKIARTCWANRPGTKYITFDPARLIWLRDDGITEAEMPMKDDYVPYSEPAQAITLPTPIASALGNCDLGCQDENITRLVQAIVAHCAAPQATR